MSNLTGKPALLFSVLDSNGTLHTQEEFRKNWLLLVFHRHLG